MGNLCGNFCNKNQEKDLSDFYEYTKKNDILIIPLINEYHLANLYPKEDEVEKWNIFIIGSDKTYIFAKVSDDTFEINENNILNNDGVNSMSNRFKNFLNKMWDTTLSGTNLQFFTYINSKLYLLNSYGLNNKKNEIVGATLFIREAGLINQNIFKYN